MNENYQTIKDAGYELAYVEYEDYQQIVSYRSHFSGIKEALEHEALEHEHCVYGIFCQQFDFLGPNTLKNEAIIAPVGSELDDAMNKIVALNEEIFEFFCRKQAAFKEAKEIAAELPPTTASTAPKTQRGRL